MRSLTVRSLALGAVVVFGVALIPGQVPAAAQSAPECAPSQPGGPMWITADCADPQYNRPVIDSEQDRADPVPHRAVSGHFAGTDARFTFYFPPKGQWEGRFFQLVYPLQDENATGEDIAFAAASGAYRVQTRGTLGYRVDAAAAKFSKKVAAAYYGTSERIYGYIYGGSGGSYQTIGAMENSTGVWAGGVPFVPGVPTSIPNFFFVRAFARLVLADKAPQIADAVRSGGSGDPYAALDDVERDVLREVTRMGVPLEAWRYHADVLGWDDPEGLLGFAGDVRGMDPAYADDFWSKPGYLGTERSPLGEVFRSARIDEETTITRVNRDAQGQPASLVLAGAPANPAKLPLDFTAVEPDGTTIGTVAGSLDPATKVLTLDDGNPPGVLDALAEDGRIRMDNRWSLALLAYHRHQVPEREGYAAWDQFRGPDGQPIYPQRDVEVGPAISNGVSGGGTHTGAITGKMIVVTNLLDSDAFPWAGDWYRAEVKRSLGEDYDDTFRLWFNDNADHHRLGEHPPGLVEYGGILQQALRDVSAWAERGKAPPRSTRYEVSDGQVLLPDRASQRKGIQPVVDVTASGERRIEVDAGEPVSFDAAISVAPGAGRVVATEWDFTGDGNFTSRPFGPPRARVHATETHAYPEPGTYFATVRATSNRDGAVGEPFARVANLGQVRVIVR